MTTKRRKRPLSFRLTPATQLSAADELKTHIEAISGARIPITGDDTKVNGVKTLIGPPLSNSSLNKMRKGSDDPATFRISVTNGTVQLMGLSDQGILFAVYELLEQLGVRWFVPGEIGTDIPQNSTITVPHQDIIQHPGFVGRILTLDGRGNNSQKWFSRMKMGGFNTGGLGLGIHADPETEPELFMMGNNHRTKFAHVERTSGGTKIKVSHPKVLQRV